ncbi:2-amino-4-hydroxy-6-hydroxymethyldihydropteridine diphosphokinase [Yimella sp. cx-51]|uniref:2-amino-4-hydroxy-6- hydroxymethyldihydropteridine diphosphokinase n=1 Tax=Yimella sp. cx-51 TaxID=2770551 RepID=UPI00165E27BE|nr:2-amino-4-hydroxy-6-hydroxymethyldihydropteridine diphosphokinase [Yimella sp. cx-51]MBC9956394.1 2-amino-4-hydroxy-6-hydroxymethyldihydropteridine diphosphokinase [Yimella sp. cx-51]QTH38487.1 2-amino-4-hydroxy-6-hydroxymethyldihydropteridine diphosphokinase [Yimella sp. cx-51]
MSDRITITGLEVTTCHGVLDSEKVEPQRFLADIAFDIDLRRAGETDDLTASVSYADVAQAAEAILRSEPVDLIETLAERIAASTLAFEGVESVEVTIRKPQAPAGVPFHDPLLGGPAVTVRRYHDRPVVIAAGANLGDRQATLAAAVNALDATNGLTVVAVAPFVETDPVGGPDQPDYLNTVILARTRLAPLTLLDRLNQIEAWHHRTREVRWGARTLDLDLIQVGDPGDDSDLRSDTARLTLPHPRAHERGFVLVPWASVDPGARLRTADGVHSVVDLLDQVDTTGVRSAHS